MAVHGQRYRFVMNRICMGCVEWLLSLLILPSNANVVVRPLAVSAEALAAMTRYGLEAYENGDAKHPVHALLYTPKAWLPAALLLLAIPIVCVFYTAPSVKWMLDNTIPRLVWYLLAVPPRLMELTSLSSIRFQGDGCGKR